MERAQKVSETIKRLLLSFQGLETLYLHMGQGDLVSKETVNNHSRTLHCLAVGTAQPKPIACQASDLSLILNSCSNLTQIAVSIGLETTPWEGLCQNILDLEGPSTIGAQANRFQDILVSPGKQYKVPSYSKIIVFINQSPAQIATASHPRLHSFRIMDPPFLDWNGDNIAAIWTDTALEMRYVEVAATCLPNLATQILRFLCEEGSRIRALAWIPIWLGEHSDSAKDSNGQQWLGYAYFKGYLGDAHGVIKVVAIPVADIPGEMPESSIYILPWQCLLAIANGLEEARSRAEMCK